MPQWTLRQEFAFKLPQFRLAIWRLAVLKIENWNETREVFTHNGKYRDELNVIMDEILNFFMVSMFQNFFQLVDSGGNGIRFLIIGWVFVVCLAILLFHFKWKISLFVGGVGISLKIIKQEEVFVGVYYWLQHGSNLIIISVTLIFCKYDLVEHAWLKTLRN